MGVKWTSEQQKVIETRGCNLLVSAAAGSGKTAVLVARILSMVMDPHEPVDIDRLLVVTFTNAAAAEMRQRIRDALEERAESEPENVHLQRQLVLIHHASIMTIHSFCLQVLRSHFHTIGLDPSFRVADEGEMLLLKQDVLDEVLEEAYEEAFGEERKPAGDETEEFRLLLEQFATGRSDRSVSESVLALYHFSLGQPWPKEWLRQCAQEYRQPENGENPWKEEPAWLSLAAAGIQRELADIAAQLQEALRITEEPDGPYPYQKALQDDLEMVEMVCHAKDYASLAAAFGKLGRHTRLSAKRDPNISEEKRRQVQELRNAAKDALSDIRAQYFYDRPEIIREEFFQSGVVVRALTRLAERFGEKLALRKAEKNILDFNDLEHKALQILVSHGEEDLPTVAAREYAEQFVEILTDEYQDSNQVQELLLQSISGRGVHAGNRFMVGDVKQSIYRFRLARPELFLEKYRTYRPDGRENCRIDLHRNFRSRTQVLSGVNYLFRQLMTEAVGGIVYGRDAALYAGASYGDASGMEPELLLLEANGPERQKEEARMVGMRIRELVGKLPVWDPGAETGGGFRPARYRDIVILLRTVSGWGEQFLETLLDMGIPCFAGSQKGYFSAVEVRTILACLQILDNPLQDIPLAAVLRSPIGGLTDEELALIRCQSGQRRFYDSCREYLEKGEDGFLCGKLERFFQMVERFRKKAAYTPVHQLIWELLEETGYGDYAASQPAGRLRRANLDMLIEKAIAYEATSYRGLYHFVRYIENLKKYEVDYGEANVGTEADDTVRIMSIHKSKGLEFPVVFVCGMGKSFNEMDLRSRLVLHPELGIGCDFADASIRLRRANLLKRVIRNLTAAENAGEELRILYVAMTRAREKLILTGSVPDAEGSLVKWSAAACEEKAQLSFSVLMKASCFLDWVMPALLRHPSGQELLPSEGVLRLPPVLLPSALAGAEAGEETALQDEWLQMMDAQFAVRLLRPEEIGIGLAESVGREREQLLRALRPEEEKERDEEARCHLERVFGSSYPYENSQEIPGKLSVSELKRLSHIPEDAEALYQEETVVPLIPAFRGGKVSPGGAARGTIYHTFMENYDFQGEAPPEIQLEELVRCGKMTEDESSCVQISQIRRFLETETGRALAKAARSGVLYREHPFVLGVPASQIRSSWSPEETVLVQGIIDAWFIGEDGRIVLVDYKTDRVSGPEELVNRYRIQADCYALALQRLVKREVKERIFYSFFLGQEIRL